MLVDNFLVEGVYCTLELWSNQGRYHVCKSQGVAGLPVARPNFSMTMKKLERG
jgi:hypothetical protein